MYYFRSSLFIPCFFLSNFVPNVTLIHVRGLMEHFFYNFNYGVYEEKKNYYNIVCTMKGNQFFFLLFICSVS